MINDSLNDEVYYDRLNADEQVVGFKLMYTHLYIFNRALNYHETENCYIISPIPDHFFENP